MNETAEAPSIAVIRARMPYIDRRSLSEAWFSALHVASDGTVAPKPADRRGVPFEHPDSHRNERRTEAQRAPETSRATGSATSSRTSRALAEPALRTSFAPRTRLRAAAAHARSYAPFRTSLTLGVDGERVALLLRREGPTLHVVALCRPAVAELVRRALACAALFLRARGDAVVSHVETVASEVVA